MEQPHLLPKLQTALSCLYNTNNTNDHYRHEAHQFLLTFKSSNLRRLVVSRLQSQKDKSNNTILLEDDLQKHAQESSSQTTGSIYLSCLALLLTQPSNSNQGATHNNSHERIFAAQTLNHRCRSIKLVEAYDIEAEDGLECGVARMVLAWEEKKWNIGSNDDDWGGKSRAILNAWVERYVPMLVHCCGGIGDRNSTSSSLCHGGKLLAVVLERHSSSLLHGSDQEERGEERIKGNLTMLTLAVALYSSAFAEYEEEYYAQQQKNQPRTPWANAVLSELGAALSIIALRIRYRPTQSKHDTPSSEPDVPPLIDLLIHSIHMVGEAATVYFLQQQHGRAQSLVEACHIHAIKRSVGACLTALPETVLLPPGSDRGEDNHRIPSIDRACLRAASLELRSEGTNMGMERMWIEMLNSELGENVNNNYDMVNLTDRLDDASALRLLECCESWARFVWVPLHVIDATVATLAVKYFSLTENRARDNTSMQYQKAQNAAFQYVISIFEGASCTLTLEDILSATLGVAAGKGNPNKKKQTSKSKKRQERRLKNAAITVDDEAGSTNVVDPSCSAEEELLRRKLSSCVAAAAVYGVSVQNWSPTGDESFGLRSATSTPSTSTHSICSTISISASSVLPHLLWLERNASKGNMSSEQWWLELFSLILVSVRRLCQSSKRDIRALAYEPLMILHESLNSTPVVRLRMEQIAVDAVCECALALAASCAYPDNYFFDLAIDNDEELEFERNDVRDVVRSVSSLETGNFGTTEHKSPSMLVLEHLVNTCNNVIKETALLSLLPPESVVHALSALAKPLNKLGKKYAEQPTQNECIILITSLLALGSVCERLNQSFSLLSMSQILPVSRLALMGLASLSPLFSSLVEVKTSRAPINEIEKELIHLFENTLRVSLQHAIISSAKLPELAAESTLKSTRYDIRGAMRGPGGEDHVGCIALMRLSFESDNLAFSLLSICDSSLLHDIASLYQELKASEHSRPPKCDYGIGVCPISRRLVLRSLSRLCMLQMTTPNDESGKSTLHGLLQVTLSELSTQKDLPISNLFNNPSGELACVFECVLAGYSRLLFSADSCEWNEQWARLRGAAVCLLRTCFKECVPDYCVDIASAVIRAECEAATRQCEQGPSSGSNLFNDNIIGDDMLHAGAFLMVVREMLTSIGAKCEVGAEKPLLDLRRCIAILAGSSAFVMPLLLIDSPEATSHTDPRPAMAEAWFLTMTSLVSTCRGSEADLANENGIQDLVGGSLFVSVALIFMKDLGNKKSLPPEIQRGMSSDGPQTLAMMEFMTEALLLGPCILAATSSSFTNHFQITSAYQNEELGASVIAAGLLRAISGALPPWAVELTPTLTHSLFAATGNECEIFIRVLKNATTLECSGSILAGRYFENVSIVHIDAFLSKTKDMCNKGDWGKLKSVLKSACGGKKKESGFNLKPQYTCWECDRL